MIKASRPRWTTLLIGRPLAKSTPSNFAWRRIGTLSARMDSASRSSNARETVNSMPEGRRERCGHELGGPNCVDHEVLDEQAKADRVISGQSVARP